MMPARRAPRVCQAKPDSSGLDADGEIIAVGVAPPAYTRAAARDVLELKCPTTATTAGSAYNCSATRTAVSSFPESSTTRNSNLRPRMPRLALIWFTAIWAARSIEAPRGWEKGPARPMAIGPGGAEHAASAAAAAMTSDFRRASSTMRGKVKLACEGTQHSPPTSHDFHAVFQTDVDNFPDCRSAGPGQFDASGNVRIPVPICRCAREP